MYIFTNLCILSHHDVITRDHKLHYNKAVQHYTQFMSKLTIGTCFHMLFGSLF